LLAIGFDVLEPIALALGDWGKVSISAFALAVVAIAALWLGCSYEPRSS